VRFYSDSWIKCIANLSLKNKERLQEKQILLHETLLNDSKFEFLYEVVHQHKRTSQQMLSSCVTIFKEISLSITMISMMTKGNKTSNTMNELIDSFLQEIASDKNTQFEIFLTQRKEFLSVISPINSYLIELSQLIQDSAVLLKNHLLKDEKKSWRKFFGKRGEMESEVGMGCEVIMDDKDKDADTNKYNQESEQTKQLPNHHTNQKQENQGNALTQSLTENMENLIKDYYGIRAEANFGSARCPLHQKFFLLYESSLFTTFQFVESWIQLINTVTETDNTKLAKLKGVKTIP